MKDFKFLKIKKPLLTNSVVYCLKDVHNRNKYFNINWTQYPTNDYDEYYSNYCVFHGNILEFYNAVQFGINGTPINPKVYEIYFQRRGYISHSKVYDNHFQLRQFISRGWNLRIVYTIE